MEWVEMARGEDGWMKRREGKDEQGRRKVLRGGGQE